jgi:hypothetical protein
MRCVRVLSAGFLGLVVTLGPPVVLSGCGDDTTTTGTQVKEDEKAKAERTKTEDAMRDMMAKKAAPKTPGK